MTIGLPYSIYICCHVSQWIEDEKKWLQQFLCSVLMIFGVLKYNQIFEKLKKMIGKSLTNRLLLAEFICTIFEISVHFGGTYDI